MALRKIRLPKEMRELKAVMTVENLGDKKKYVLNVPACKVARKYFDNKTKEWVITHYDNFPAYRRSLCGSIVNSKRKDLIVGFIYDYNIDIKGVDDDKGSESGDENQKINCKKRSRPNYVLAENFA